MTDPLVGTVLGGKYVVEGILGRGGMGVVVAARHRDLDQRVAIKCLLEHALKMPDVVERFAREARAAAKIQGEHVARVIDVGRFDDGTPYMVMEHLQGHDLSVEIEQRGRLSAHDAVRYVLETCEALAQAHATRIVHRDLKPSNLFLAEQPGRRPIVKVLDFGISKVVDSSAGSLTKTSSVLGTPYYMSPEQLLSSKNVDERSDIWSLGVVLYELLVGHPPFMGETAHEIIAKIVQNTPQPPRLLRPDLDPGLEAVILTCMRTRPEERFANVAELAAALMPFGAPSDRESVTAIARVLGLQPLGPSMMGQGPLTQSAPNAAFPAPVVAHVTTGPTRISAQPQPPPPALSAASYTGMPVARTPSMETAQLVAGLPRRGWVLPAVLGLLVAVAGGTFVFVRHGLPTAAGSGAVGTTTIIATATVTATASAGLPSAALTPLPGDTASSPSAAAPAVVAASAVPAAQRVTRQPTPAPVVVAARPVAAAAAPVAAPPPAANAPAPPPTTTAKNPLDLQLK